MEVNRLSNQIIRTEPRRLNWFVMNFTPWIDEKRYAVTVLSPEGYLVVVEQHKGDEGEWNVTDHPFEWYISHFDFGAGEMIVRPEPIDLFNPK